MLAPQAQLPERQSSNTLPNKNTSNLLRLPPRRQADGVSGAGVPMKKSLIAISLGLISFTALAGDKFIYTPADGKILTDTPAPTVGKNNKILGSRIWNIVDDSPALGTSDDLWNYSVVTNEYPDIDGGESVYEVVTNRIIKSNISELESYTKLYPQSEDERQAAKDVGLKTLENQFILYYGSLGFDEKPGFEEITAMLQTWTNELDAAKQAIIGLSIDAAAKRYNALWWDDCSWHQEMAE